MPGFEVIGDDESQALVDVIQRGGVLHRYGFDSRRNGNYYVSAFENAFSRRLHVSHAHAVTSGTAALVVALKALGVGSGDEVITQSFTFVATAEAIIACGAKPVFTEVDDTLNMDPADLLSRITERTRVIIPVHMLGVPCAMDDILAIAEHHHLSVIEDACEALGGSYHGKSLGTIGTLGAFSFDFGKTLTTGEGGMIVTNSESLYRQCREYADHGHEQNSALPRGKDTHSRPGFNFRMMELQGAFGVAQLQKLDFILTRQRGVKQKLKEAIRDIPGLVFRRLPDPDGDSGDTLVFFLETSSLANRFVVEWQSRSYGTKNIPDALDWHYAGRWSHILLEYAEYRDKSLPEYWPRSTDILSRAVALPIMVQSSDAIIDTMATVIREIVQGL